MDSIFGVPADRLLAVLLVLFALGAAILTASALRNRVAFKMAVRNIPRRRAQTALIVMGLMLSMFHNRKVYKKHQMIIGTIAAFRAASRCL